MIGMGWRDMFAALAGWLDGEHMLVSTDPGSSVIDLSCSFIWALHNRHRYGLVSLVFSFSSR